MLSFAPPVPQEKELRERIAVLHDVDQMPPDVPQAVKDGMANAWAEYDTFKKVDTGQVGLTDLFGSDSTSTVTICG